jgi:uncharacterized repeat protein (TIGR03803 family)
MGKAGSSPIANISKLQLVVVLGLLVIACQIARAQTETVLYNFCSLSGCADGSHPNTSLILDPQGNLYGEAGGGAHRWGVVYRVAQNGAESPIYSFHRGPGADPWGGLLRDQKGDLYGTTQSYYRWNDRYYGTVFELKKGVTLRYLYEFPAADEAGGWVPSGRLAIDSLGNLYGTAAYGGDVANCSQQGGSSCGLVFELTAPKTDKVLYNFAGGTDGANPNGGLIFDAAGNLYGTTTYGGSEGANCQQWPGGCGTVFKLAPDGTETVLHSFAGGTDGANPDAGLVMDAQGNLYGATYSGGATGYGTVFKLAPDGTETVLYNFAGAPDGANPNGELAMDAEGNLYGTTAIGGTLQCAYDDGCGTVFKLTPAGQETILYRFNGGWYMDGAYPHSGLVLDAQGNLYGTTDEGGSSPLCGSDGCGTVFEIKITP